MIVHIQTGHSAFLPAIVIEILKFSHAFGGAGDDSDCCDLLKSVGFPTRPARFPVENSPYHPQQPDVCENEQILNFDGSLWHIKFTIVLINTIVSFKTVCYSDGRNNGLAFHQVALLYRHSIKWI